MIHSLKLLCPNLHLIAGTVYDAEAVTLNEVKTFLARELSVILRSGRCPICESGQETWRYDMQPTNFQSLEEASAYFILENEELILIGGSYRHHPGWAAMARALRN